MRLVDGKGILWGGREGSPTFKSRPSNNRNKNTMLLGGLCGDRIEGKRMKGRQVKQNSRGARGKRKAGGGGLAADAAADQ